MDRNKFCGVLTEKEHNIEKSVEHLERLRTLAAMTLLCAPQSNSKAVLTIK